MKKSLLIGLIGVGGMLLTAQSQAVLITYWNFNSGTPLIVSTTDSSVATATATPSGTSTTFGGSLINAVGADPAGNAFAYSNGTSAPNGSTLIFQVNSSTSTYSNLVATWAATRSASGFSTNTVEGSADGSTWYGLTATSVPTAFALQTVSFSSVPQLANIGTFYVRMTFTGATTGGTTRVDNFQINGDVAPVPEPTSLAAIGIGAVALIRRKKAR